MQKNCVNFFKINMLARRQHQELVKKLFKSHLSERKRKNFLINKSVYKL